jgi:transposase InsO family protein
LGKRSLIHNRDPTCAQARDGLLKASDVEPVILPPRRPHLNAHCERFGRSIQEEAQHRMVMLGEPTLPEAISQSLSHDHAERKHQGLDKPITCDLLSSLFYLPSSCASCASM